MSYDKSIYATLVQINAAINQLKEWNVGINSADDYLISPDGMKTLAATSMLLEAVGEGIKKLTAKLKVNCFSCELIYLGKTLSE